MKEIFIIHKGKAYVEVPENTPGAVKCYDGLWGLPKDEYLRVEDKEILRQKCIQTERMRRVRAALKKIRDEYPNVDAINEEALLKVLDDDEELLDELVAAKVIEPRAIHKGRRLYAV